MIKCTYCGEAEGTEKIMNPNGMLEQEFDKEPVWNVCLDCKETIKAQQMLSIAMVLGDNKIASECQKKIEEISVRRKMPVISATIYKKDDGTYDSVSVEYTGEKD